MEPLTINFSVRCSPEQAFAVWTENVSQWWPRDHKMSPDPDAAVTYEPKAGGRIYERAGDGSEHDWGEVMDWQPPRRLTYVWHIGSSRSQATVVEIDFQPGPEGSTEVTPVHSDWEALAIPEETKEGNRRGWADVVPPFQVACGA